MSTHQPTAFRTRHSATAATRPTHQASGFMAPLSGGATAADQTALDRDGGISAGDILEGAISTPAIRPDTHLDGSMANMPATVTIDELGLHILDGALEIKDEFGVTVATSTGFSGGWEDFIRFGIYNARFIFGTAGVVPNGRSAALTHWTVSNSLGTPTATFLAAGGVKVTFNVTTDSKLFISDVVPVQRGLAYTAQVVADVARTSGILSVVLQVLWYKSDLSASSTPSTSFDGISVGASGIYLSGGTVADAPDDAAYAAIALAVTESSTHNAANSVTLLAASLRDVPPEFLYSLSTPTHFVFDDVDMNGSLVVAGDSTIQANLEIVEDLLLDGTIIAVGGFPVSPVTDQQAWRGDLGMWFRYDGTRWLCTCQHALPLSAAITNIAATDTDIARTAAPAVGSGTDIWVEALDVGYHVTAGTALSGSHKWTVDIKAVAAGGAITTIATKTINSGASAVWRRDAAQAVNALTGLQAYWFVVATKTGTPGNLYFYPILTYRIVAT